MCARVVAVGGGGWWVAGVHPDPYCDHHQFVVAGCGWRVAVFAQKREVNYVWQRRWGRRSSSSETCCAGTASCAGTAPRPRPSSPGIGLAPLRSCEVFSG